MIPLDYFSDGASRASNRIDPVSVNGEYLYYRGFRVLQATLDSLLASTQSAISPASVAPDMPSLADAESLVLSGSSAGGLTVYLHADFIADAVRQAAGSSVKILAVPEVGFFVDGESSMCMFLHSYDQR